CGVRRRKEQAMSRRSTIAVLAAGLTVGGVAGLAIGLSNAAGAASPSPSPSATATRSFHSNEDPTPEAGQSAARQAAENSRHGFGGPGLGHRPNEDPTHEAGESAARAAQENAAQNGAA